MYVAFTFGVASYSLDLSAIGSRQCSDYQDEKHKAGRSYPSNVRNADQLVGLDPVCL